MPDPRRQRLKTAIGVAASLLIAGLATWVLYQTFQRIEPADVVQKMREVPRAKLLLAAACALGAFLAIALYEGIAVRYVKRSLGIGKPALTALSPTRSVTRLARCSSAPARFAIACTRRPAFQPWKSAQPC